jgi:putative glutathione S-transferase
VARHAWSVPVGRVPRLPLGIPCGHRARLLGLEHAISLAVVDPIQDERSWRFTLDPYGVDPVLGIKFLSEAY